MRTMQNCWRPFCGEIGRKNNSITLPFLNPDSKWARRPIPNQRGDRRQEGEEKRKKKMAGGACL